MRPPTVAERARRVFARHAQHNELSRSDLLRAVRSDKELQSLLHIGTRSHGSASPKSPASFAGVFAGMDVDSSDLVDQEEFVRFVVQQHPVQQHPVQQRAASRAVTPPSRRARRTSSWKRPPPLPTKSGARAAVSELGLEPGLEPEPDPRGSSSSSNNSLDDDMPPRSRLGTGSTPPRPRVSFGVTFPDTDGDEGANAPDGTSAVSSSAFRSSQDGNSPKPRLSVSFGPLSSPMMPDEDAGEEEEEVHAEDEGGNELTDGGGAGAENEDEHTALLRFLSGDSSALLRASNAAELIVRARLFPQDFDELMQPARMTALQIPEHSSRSVDDVGTSTLMDVPAGFVPGLPTIVSEDDIAELCAYMTVGETTEWHDSLRRLLLRLELLFDMRSQAEVATAALGGDGGDGADAGFSPRTSAEFRQTRRRLKTVTSHPSARDLRATFHDHTKGGRRRTPSKLEQWKGGRISHKMGVFAMPVSFANSSEPLQLLQACADRCVDTIDASVFSGEVVRALEKYVWSPTVVRTHPRIYAHACMPPSLQFLLRTVAVRDGWEDVRCTRTS